MQIDSAEASVLLKRAYAVIYKNLGDLVLVAGGTRYLETRSDSGVLVKGRTFRQPLESTLNGLHLCPNLLVSKTFFVYTGKRKETAIATGL